LLDLAEHQLDPIQVGTGRWQEDQADAGCFDALADALALVAGQDVRFRQSPAAAV